MKFQFYISLLITIAYSLQCFGTHNMAGQITFVQTGSKTIEATVHTYTKPGSVATDTDSLQICWGDGSCEIIIRTLKEPINGFFHNEYTYTHTYQEFGSYLLSMTEPNRNGAILNINPPGSENVPFHIQTEFDLSADFNNSPVLLELPLERGFSSEPFIHNSNAYDADCDSIAYELIQPMADINIPVPNYLQPYMVPGNNPSQFVINEVTGSVFWDSPQIAGAYVIAIMIKEFRNGELISSMVRDLQFSIFSEIPGNENPEINTPFDYIEVNAGDTVNFDVDYQDLSGFVELTVSGGSFEVADPSIFNIPPTSQPTPFNLNYSWQTQNHHVCDHPYQIVFKAFDLEDTPTGAMFLKVVRIKVLEGPVAVSELEEEMELKVFPNPAFNSVYLEWKPLNIVGKMTISLINELGQTVFDDFVNSGALRYSLDTTIIPNGVYFLRINMENQLILKKVIIQH